MYKAGLFDLDGTLTDSLNLSIHAFIHTFRVHLGQEYTPEAVLAMLGPCEEGVFRRHSESKAPVMLETFLDYYRRRHDHYATFYPGILPVIAQLKEKMPLAVITGKGREPARITLEKTGLAPHFDLVISGSCVKRHKPDPEGIEAALTSLGAAPAQAFYLGDSLSDLETARRAGVTPLAALWGSREKEELRRGDPAAAFTHPRELLLWLRGNDAPES